MKTDPNFIALWNEQTGKCAITHLPMDQNGEGLEQVVMVPVGFKHRHQKGKKQLALKWAADARGKHEDTEVRAVLSRHKAHRDRVFEHMADLRAMMDHIAIILRRGGLSTRSNSVTGLSVYRIEEPNEFDGRPVATVEYRGFIHFQSDIQYGRDKIGDKNWHVLDLADPNYHVVLLKFFGVEDYVFQIFADHDVFADL